MVLVMKTCACLIFLETVDMIQIKVQLSHGIATYEHICIVGARAVDPFAACNVGKHKLYALQ